MRRSNWLRAIVASLVLIVGITAFASAHGGRAKRIHSCVNGKTKLVRIVKPSRSCRSKETARDWNIRGRRGRRGAQGIAGPAGAPGPQGETGPQGEDRTPGRRPGDLTGALSLVGHSSKAACTVGETAITMLVKDHIG